MGEGLGGGGGNSKKFWAGVCRWNFEYTPIHIISRLTKHTYSYNLHVKRYPIHIIEVNTSRNKTDNLIGNYMQNINVHFACCFDSVCDQVSCLPKLEINGLLLLM